MSNWGLSKKAAITAFAKKEIDSLLNCLDSALSII
jgi:hypothetical protein